MMMCSVRIGVYMHKVYDVGAYLYTPKQNQSPLEAKSIAPSLDRNPMHSPVMFLQPYPIPRFSE